MASLVTLAEAQKNEIRREASPNDSTQAGISRLPYFRFDNDPDLPFATLNKHDTGRLTGTQYHRVDQFQVVVGGRGIIGRRNVSPLHVRFIRAYTPYGPIYSQAGFAFFVLRARPDQSSLRIPEARAELERVKNRQPWQIARPAIFPALPEDGDIVGEMVRGFQDDNGLGAHMFCMNSDTAMTAPSPSGGAGQYVMVITGTLVHNGFEYGPLSLAFLRPDEAPLRLQAGSIGLEVLILNFPREGSVTAARRVGGPSSRRCSLCAYSYDEAQGSPEDHIPRGTPWEKLPETWTCPDCDAAKQDFIRCA